MFSIISARLEGLRPILYGFCSPPNILTYSLVETKNNQINIIREGSLSKKLINEELKNFKKKHY